MAVLYVDGKIKNDRAFTCVGCGKQYPSLADSGAVYNRTGSMYGEKHTCKPCYQANKN